MKLSRSTAMGAFIAAVVLACLLAPVGSAWSLSLDDTPSVTSSTNPASQTFWGNSLKPEFTIQPLIPSDPDTSTMGFFYGFTRFNPGPVDTSTAPVSWDPGGAMISHTFDLYNWFRDSGHQDAVPSDVQGIWWFNTRFYASGRIATATTGAYRFGIDITPPELVEGFTTSSFVPTQASRRTIQWWNKEYDALSGITMYHLYLNGQEFKTVKVDEIPVWMGDHPYLTLEDLPVGISTIGISVEDRARNMSAMKTLKVVVDPDYPTLSVSPGDGSWLRGTVTFSANASDAAGISHVDFRLDGSLKQSSATLRTFSVNTTGLRAGSHTLQVAAYDLFGHVRTVTRTFYVDNTAPSFSSVSHGPDPWYPCLQDGYKDIATFKGYVDEYVTDLFCQLYDEDGKTLLAEGHITNMHAGNFTFTSNGRDKDTNAPMYIGPIGSYRILKWRFTAKDRAGNWRNMPLQTIEVRNYEIVDNAGGGVKVIPR